MPPRNRYTALTVPLKNKKGVTFCAALIHGGFFFGVNVQNKSARRTPKIARQKIFGRNYRQWNFESEKNL